jgi:hypothetical protein
MERSDMKWLHLKLVASVKVNDKVPNKVDKKRIINVSSIGVKYLMMSGVSSLKFMYENGLDTNKYEILN